MSDTPRTDAATERMDDDHGTPCLVVPVKVAKKLERESDQLAKQCVRNVEEIGTMRIELAEAKKDAARFDWLLKYATRGASYIQCMGFRVNDRKSIDAAMEAANDE